MPVHRALRVGSYLVSSTSGSVLFVDSSSQIAQNNSAFFWDSTNNRLGIGTSSPSGNLQVTASSAATIPIIIRGATSQTANLTEWQNSSGTALTVIDSAGKLGIGTAPSAPLHVISTTEQIRVGYNSSAYTSTTIDSNGAITANVNGQCNGSRTLYTIQATNIGGLGAYNLFGLKDHTGSQVFTVGSAGSVDFGAAITSPGYNTTSNVVWSATSGQSYGGSVTAFLFNTASGFGAADSAKAYNFQIASADRFTIYESGRVLLANGLSSAVAFQVRGAAAQSANLQQWQNSSGTVLTSIASDGTISSPGAGSSSEHFGASSIASGSSSVAFGAFAQATTTVASAFGYNAQATGTNATAIGATTTASNTQAVALGYGASASGANSFALGTSANASGARGMALGASCGATATDSVAVGTFGSAGHNYSVCVGNSATSTATNQFIVGATGKPINTVFIGSGVTDTSPANVVYNATGGSGTDIAGASLTIAGGKGTGSGTPGAIIFQTSTAAGSSSTLQTLAERLRISQTTEQVLLTTGTASLKGLTVRGASSQTANLQEWQNSSSTALASVSAAGTMKITGFGHKVVSKTATYTAADETVILCDATAASFTINLAAASTMTDRIYHIKKTDSSANTITVDPNGTETIDGSSTKILTTQYDCITIVCDGSNWFII